MRLPMEVEVPTSAIQIANNLYVTGWSKQTEGIHLLKFSLLSKTWREQLNFADYIIVENDAHDNQ